MRCIRFFLWCSFYLSILLYAACKFKNKNINDIAFKTERNAIINKYPHIPNDDMLLGMNNNALYNELKERYRQSLITLKAETDNDSARLVVVIFSPEVGKELSLSNTYGIPYIIQCCNQIGIDCIDLSAAIAEKDPSQVAQVPFDGYWSKPGASFVADVIAKNVIEKYKDDKITKTYPLASKIAIFGDLPPRHDDIIEGEKDMPYRLKVNAQGLRMDHDLLFPKKKQTLLFLGGTDIFQPYIDNEFISTIILNKKYPDKEIVNAAMENYTLEDDETLYREKARYTHPDVVIVFTNGKDILGYYFSARNKYSRSKQIYMPSEKEITYYREIYKKNQ